MFPPSTIAATKSKLNTGKARRSVETQSLTSSDPKIASSNDAEFLKNADLELCLLGKKKNPLEKDISVQNYEVLETLKISAPIAREVITRTLVDAIHSGKNSTQVKAKLPQTSETEKFRPVYAVKAKYQDRTRDYLFDFSTNEIDTAPLVVFSSHAGKDSESLIRRYSVMTHYGTVFDVLFNTHDPTFIDRNKSTVYVAMQNFRIGDELRQGTVVRWGMYNCYLTGQEIEELDFPKHPECKKPVPVITFLKKDQFSYPSLKAVSEGANAPDATHESNLEANRQNAVKSLTAKRTIKTGEPINESNMLQRWVLGSPVKENTSANRTVPNDYVVTGIDYKLHPVCVDTIIAGKPIHAHQMKFLDPH
jgi:hypothetical protein